MKEDRPQQSGDRLVNLPNYLVFLDTTVGADFITNYQCKGK